MGSDTALNSIPGLRFIHLVRWQGLIEICSPSSGRLPADTLRAATTELSCANLHHSQVRIFLYPMVNLLDEQALWRHTASPVDYFHSSKPVGETVA